MKSSGAQRYSAKNIGPPPSQDGPGRTLASLLSETDEPTASASNSAQSRCQKSFAFLKGLLEGRQAEIASSHSQGGDKAHHGMNAASRKGCDPESPCGDEESVYFTSSETSFRLRTAIKKKRRKKRDNQLRRLRHHDKTSGERFSGNETDFMRPEPLASFSTFMRQTFARLESGRDPQPDGCDRKGGRVVVRKEQPKSRSQSPMDPSSVASFNFGWTSTLVNNESPPQLIEQQPDPSDRDSTLTVASQSRLSLPGYNYTKMNLPDITGFFGVREPVRAADEKRRAVNLDYNVAKINLHDAPGFFEVMEPIKAADEKRRAAKREYDIAKYDYKIMQQLYSDDDELYDDRKRSARRRSPTEIGVDQASMRAVHLSLSDCSGLLRSAELLPNK